MPSTLGIVASGEDVFNDAVLWLDTARSVAGETTMVNYGKGGSALNATYGSSAGADTNDPLLLTHTGTNYLYLPGVAGNYASTPDAAALDITGDIEIVARIKYTTWIPAAETYVVSKIDTTVNQRSWALSIQPINGRPSIRWSTAGTASSFVQSSVSPGFTNDTTYWIKVTFDVDNGAGGNTARFYYAADQATEPSSWTQIGTDVVTAGTTSIFSGTSRLEIGSINAGSGGSFSPCSVYRAIVRNGIDGTTVFDANFTTGITSGGQTTFTESSANAATVTINRSTSSRKSVAVVRNVLLFGTDDYLEVADNDLLDFGASDSFTALAVLRQWATPTSFGVILDKSTTNNNGWTLQGKTDFKLWTQVEDSGAAAAATLSSLDAGTSAGALAVRYMRLNRSSATFEAGVNNTTPASTSAASVGTLANSSVMRVGRFSGVSSNYNDMELVAVAVWRRALTANEIATAVARYA